MRLFFAFKVFFVVLFSGARAETVRKALAGALPPTVAPSPPSREGAGKKPSATGPVGPGLGAVAAVLSLLQREARFVDFLMEDVEPYGDAQVGAAARGVHRGCRKALQEYIELQPVRDEKEGDPLTLEPGFNAGSVRLSGNVSGDPPFTGVLRHPGWRLVKASVPIPPADQDALIVCPAEVEI